MIAYDTDGLTLFFVDRNGTKVTKGPMDAQAYGNMLSIMDAQAEAGRVNETKRRVYTQDIANAQASIDAGRPPAVTPVAPMMLVVDDYGNSTKVPFAPPLPTLTFPVTTGSGPIKVDTPDKQAIMYNMILAMFRKMFPGQ